MDADKPERTPRRQDHSRDHSRDHNQHGDQTVPHGDPVTDAATQLQLLDDAHLPDWRLDPSTKAIGLHGIAQARAALRTARRRHSELEPGGEAHGGRATAA